MSLQVAVLGAGGFIGSRLVERLHLGGSAKVRAVVRQPCSLAGASRFAVDGRVADALDARALAAAFEGCDVVAHAIAGTPRTIVEAVAPAYRAACQAGVRRLVYLSSASVHGQAPPPGTDENSPLDARQPLAYNNAKVRAERRLLSLRASGRTEVVILRPGIVTGPRSGWQAGFARQLLAGTACWLDGGRGICNSIHVDNLVHAVLLASTAPGADGQAFIVGDAETITWADLYRPIAEALRFDLAQVPDASRVEAPPGWMDRLHEFRTRPGVKSKLSLLPMRLRRALDAALSPPPVSPPSPWRFPDDPAPPPTVSPEMAMLYRCHAKLPHRKAAAVLGYSPPVSFDEGCRRTLAWMAFAGFPVDPAYLNRAARAMNG